MKRYRFWGLVAALVLMAAIPIRADEAAGADSTTLRVADEEWLKTVWSQIDTLVRQEDFDLQETVVASGVRGAEREDELVRYYYFKGGRRYPNEGLIAKVTQRLEKRLANQRRYHDRARLKYLSAICYDLVGDRDKAREFYGRLVEEHPQSGYAAQAEKRLAQLRGR